MVDKFLKFLFLKKNIFIFEKHRLSINSINNRNKLDYLFSNFINNNIEIKLKLNFI